MDAYGERFLHLDMDAFYVEVERLDDPTLRGVPVVVGGLGPRGVVAAASYEARRTGVRSAMPMSDARRRLPHARYLPPNMAKYTAMSRRVFAIIDEFSPTVEPLSVDEAFVDISGLRLHYPAPRHVGEAMRDRIRQELALPASVGIAAVKFLAKMASKAAKPDGLRVIAAGTERDFLAPLPATELWGVGRATLAVLSGLGVETIGQLAELPGATLSRHVGEAAAAHLTALAAGRDPRPVDAAVKAKSVSVENTFPHDLTDDDTIERALLDLCHRLSGRLLRAGQAGKTITIKVRLGDFTTRTRSLTRDDAIADTSQLWAVAQELLAKVPRGGQGVRLLGVGVSALATGEPQQLAIGGPGRAALADAAAGVRERFGDDALRPARLVEGPPENMGG